MKRMYLTPASQEFISDPNEVLCASNKGVSAPDLEIEDNDVFGWEE